MTLLKATFFAEEARPVIEHNYVPEDDLYGIIWWRFPDQLKLGQLNDWPEPAEHIWKELVLKIGMKFILFCFVFFKSKINFTNYIIDFFRIELS